MQKRLEAGLQGNAGFMPPLRAVCSATMGVLPSAPRQLWPGRVHSCRPSNPGNAFQGDLRYPQQPLAGPGPKVSGLSRRRIYGRFCPPRDPRALYASSRRDRHFCTFDQRRPGSKSAMGCCQHGQVVPLSGQTRKLVAGFRTEGLRLCEVRLRPTRRSAGGAGALFRLVSAVAAFVIGAGTVQDRARPASRI